MAVKKKYITYINLNPGYKLKAETLIMASQQKTLSIRQVVIGETEMVITDMMNPPPTPPTTTTTSPPDIKDDEDDEDNPQQQDQGDTVDPSATTEDGGEGKKKGKSATKDGGGDSSNTKEKKKKNKKERVPPVAAAAATQIDMSQYEIRKVVTKEALIEIWQTSHVVMIPDSMFAKQSQVFHTEAFQKNQGMLTLGEYYQKHGLNVFILCIEGILNVGERLNDLFGTKWKVDVFENSTIEATDIGKQVIGQYLPKAVYLEGMPHFISCDPNEEGLYRKYMSTKEQFTKSFHEQDEDFERLGIEFDATMDCFNVDKSWENYQKKNTNKYCIALHCGSGNQGNIVWWGDRDQTQTELSYVFCKLLLRLDSQMLGMEQEEDTQNMKITYDPSGSEMQPLNNNNKTGSKNGQQQQGGGIASNSDMMSSLHQQLDDEDSYVRFTILLAIAAVIIAVAAKLMGF